MSENSSKGWTSTKIRSKFFGVFLKLKSCDPCRKCWFAKPYRWCSNKEIENKKLMNEEWTKTANPIISSSTKREIRLQLKEFRVRYHGKNQFFTKIPSNTEVQFLEYRHLNLKKNTKLVNIVLSDFWSIFHTNIFLTHSRHLTPQSQKISLIFIFFHFCFHFIISFHHFINGISLFFKGTTKIFQFVHTSQNMFFQLKDFGLKYFPQNWFRKD